MVAPLLIVGAGGFARETAECVRAINRQRPAWELLGFLDDDPTLRGDHLDGVPVLGPIAEVERFPHARLTVCTANPRDPTGRRRIVQRLALPPSRYATLIHPTAVLATSTRIGQGTVLLGLVVTTASVRIGSHVAVMPGVVFTHDDVVGDYATFGAGSRLAGRVHVGEGAYVGAGSLVREERSIGAEATLGMGAVVTQDVPAGEVWAGVPARRLRRVEEGPNDRLPAAATR